MPVPHKGSYQRGTVAARNKAKAKAAAAGRTQRAQAAGRTTQSGAAARKKASEAAAAATESKINKPPAGGLGGLARRTRAKKKKR